MGSFLQINATLLNADADSAYAIDPLRTGGAATDAILPSLFWNKFSYQASTFIAAFAQMLVDKGYAPNDGGGTVPGYNALVAVLSNIKTGADFSASLINVPYAGALAFNAAQSSGFETTLTGNVASSTLSGQSVGQILTFIVNQDATGNRTFAWPSSVPGQRICPLALSTSVQMFMVTLGGTIIIPLTPILWITSTGLFLQPAPEVVQISTSGNVQLIANELTEIVNCSGGNVTRNLYTAVGTMGFKVNIKRAPGDTSTSALMVQPLIGGQTIDGQASYGPIKPYNSLSFQSDGANFIIL